MNLDNDTYAVVDSEIENYSLDGGFYVLSVKELSTSVKPLFIRV